MSPTTSLSIGVILCSSRLPRVCPQISAFVVETIESWLDTSSTGHYPTPLVSLHLVDLASWNLPFFDEPTIPSEITNHEDYGQAHTRAWSLEIQKYAGFIFILPQYNWGYPAVVKNAIDYLFNEWRGKSALIVSYGGHGGVRSAAQLRQVLQGVRMNVVETMPALSFPSRETLELAAKGQSLDLLGEAGIWNSKKKDICNAFEELLGFLSQK